MDLEGTGRELKGDWQYDNLEDIVYFKMSASELRSAAVAFRDAIEKDHSRQCEVYTTRQKEIVLSFPLTDADVVQTPALQSRALALSDIEQIAKPLEQNAQALKDQGEEELEFALS